MKRHEWIVTTVVSLLAGLTLGTATAQQAPPAAAPAASMEKVFIVFLADAFDQTMVCAGFRVVDGDVNIDATDCRKRSKRRSAHSCRQAV